MPTQQERRDCARVPCMFVVLFEMTKSVGTGAVKLSQGHGHAINRSDRGMLLLLPEYAHPRQVVEIQIPSVAKSTPHTTLVEVCWTRPVSADTSVNMYLAGTRFLFEMPASIQSLQTR
jgi:hypothetical protein